LFPVEVFMKKFTVLKGIAAPMLMANINTDVISPVQLSRSASEDLGAMVFLHWRYDSNGKEISDFVLNRPPYRHSQILIAGENFGCGSSRERAVWALMRFGFRCIIAPSFAEIFKENAFQCGLLPIALNAADCTALGTAVMEAKEPLVTVDLERCVVEGPDGRQIPFTVAEERRMALLEGLEEISVLLSMEADMAVYEQADRRLHPWIYIER
jgi:3-isopropylmalate/(R)-2-methylmalate dehydratase small subunit